VRRHFSLNVRYQFVLLYTVGMAAVHAAAEDINAAIADGALPVGESAGLPLHRFDLADTAAAHSAVEESIVGTVHRLTDDAPRAPDTPAPRVR